MVMAVEEHSCPVFGIALIESDFDRPEGEYLCLYCSTEPRPSMNGSAPGLG